jgi:hypothetical protein
MLPLVARLANDDLGETVVYCRCAAARPQGLVAILGKRLYIISQVDDGILDGGKSETYNSRVGKWRSLCRRVGFR